MINVWIDEITPCLKDAETGEIVETEVVEVTRSSFLSKYNKKNHWYVNWKDLLDTNHVYALVIKGTTDIQGLVALQKNDDFQAVYIAWMCTAPSNNVMLTKKPKYLGVGGHLFAIAIDKSLEYGFEGVVTGYAANENLLHHYCTQFDAIPLRILHEFHFMIDEKSAKKIKEMYTYEWTDARL